MPAEPARRTRPNWTRTGPLSRVALVFLLTFALGGCLLVRSRPLGGNGEVKKSDLPSVKHIDGDRVWSLAKPDAIPSIDEPEFVRAADADFMDDEELVLGIVGEGVAKAYSLWHLDRHEIVNDRLGKTPIAATW